MASQHLVSRESAQQPSSSGRLDPSRAGSARRAHLCRMETTTQRQTVLRSSSEPALDPVVTMSQLASQLSVQKPVVACAPAPHSEVPVVPPSGGKPHDLAQLVREEIVRALRNS